MTLHDAISRFTRHLQASGFSPHTGRSYACDLRGLERFLGGGIPVQRISALFFPLAGRDGPDSQRPCCDAARALAPPACRRPGRIQTWDARGPLRSWRTWGLPERGFVVNCHSYCAKALTLYCPACGQLQEIGYEC